MSSTQRRGMKPACKCVSKDTTRNAFIYYSNTGREQVGRQNDDQLLPATTVMQSAALTKGCSEIRYK